MKFWSRSAVVLALLTILGAGTGLALAAVPASGATSSGTRIYWDQNEEVDWLINPGTQQPKPLVPPWDPNGQMAIFPDKTGNFTTGYNPTCASQTGNGGLTKPVKTPPIGEAVWNKNGNFTGQTLAVPGPYLGGDIPGNANNPLDCSFNNNGTYVGAAFDPRTGNFFDTDLGNAQGTVPPQDSGRLIEWFKAPPTAGASQYSSYCILFGPTMGGDPGNAQEQHHVDGTGGLRQPGTVAVDSQGNVLVPTLGVGSSLHGEVVKFAANSLPSSAAQCPGPSNTPTSSPQPTVFIDSTANDQGSPQGIAHDPTCVGGTGCWAVSSVLQGNAVSWYNDDGTPDVARPSVGPGGVPQAEAQTGPGGYSPQGLAFVPDGTLYIADIHISCVSSGGGEPGGGGCGPATDQGQILKVTFGSGSTPSAPVKVNTVPDNFPVSVTACTPTPNNVCPAPAGH